MGCVSFFFVAYTLCLPLGSVTFCWANILIRFLTTSMPRSLEAFNSNTASRKEGPNKIRAKQRMVVVFPTPGGPAMMMFGTLPSRAKTDSLDTVSERKIKPQVVVVFRYSSSFVPSLPTISSKVLGRYFSTHGSAFSFFEGFFSGSPML